MKSEGPVCEQVDISSDEEDKDPMETFFSAVFAEPANAVISEGIETVIIFFLPLQFDASR